MRGEKETYTKRGHDLGNRKAWGRKGGRERRDEEEESWEKERGEGGAMVAEEVSDRGGKARESERERDFGWLHILLGFSRPQPPFDESPFLD
jgi:hypothetical protein